MIDYFVDNGGIEELSLSGGEPLLHPDILKMVNYANEKGIRVVIFTSGVLYGDDLSQEERDYLECKLSDDLGQIELHEKDNLFLKNKVIKHYKYLLDKKKYSCINRETLKSLKDIGLDKIVFDLQGYESETDCYLMGRGEISRQALLDSLLNACFEGLEVDVHFIPMKPNYKEIGDILELLEIAKVQNISILNFVSQGRGLNNSNELRLSDSELKEFFNLLNKHKNGFSGNIRVGIPFQENTSHKCNAGIEKLDIKYDGTILPCPAFKDITDEECIKYNIKLPNIYDSLETVKISGNGKRNKPLCKEIYKF